MRTVIKQKAMWSAAGIGLAILLAICAGIRIPVLDTATGNYFHESITKAGVAYATCRAINASVSIVKESSLQLEPAGIGLSLAVGQALDPIDDMTERLSDVLVTAITSLGVQKLLHEIGITLVPPILAVCLFLLSILMWFDHERIRVLQRSVLQILLIIAIFRFCLPASSLVNAYIQNIFFTRQIQAARSDLALGNAEIDKLKNLSLPPIDGVVGTIENSTAFLKQKSIAFKDAIAHTVRNMETIIESLLRLTFLYVGVFLVQVVILPLFSFWVLVKLMNALFLTRFPVILHGASLNHE
jgi:hypothetical protein